MHLRARVLNVQYNGLDSSICKCHSQPREIWSRLSPFVRFCATVAHHIRKGKLIGCQYKTYSINFSVSSICCSISSNLNVYGKRLEYCDFGSPPRILLQAGDSKRNKTKTLILLAKKLCLNYAWGMYKLDFISDFPGTVSAHQSEAAVTKPHNRPLY